MCSLTTMITRPAVVRRHLTGVEGLEHIPLDTPFVLISNHISFADHFIYETLLFATRGAQGAFLTKAESFSGLRGIWFDSMGAVPVDRDNPVKGLLATADRILGNGRVLVVYPEGTRNREPEEMLPFKDGAFRFAERAGVPVVPAALWGTQDILPIGARAPRSGTARVVFGPPLYGNVDLPRAARLRDLTERAKAAVSGLLDQARTPEPARSAAASQQTSALADAVLERSLSGIDPVPTAIRHQQAHLLLGLARGTDRENIAARLGAVRLLGLRAMESRSPVSPAKLVRLFRVRSGATRILRKDPDQLMAHYLLGRWQGGTGRAPPGRHRTPRPWRLALRHGPRRGPARRGPDRGRGRRTGPGHRRAGP
jgi:1-acyl-sn-glycerol-3-phosphate acyltransferase